jgi:hypothetical protein
MDISERINQIFTEVKAAFRKQGLNPKRIFFVLRLDIVRSLYHLVDIGAESAVIAIEARIAIKGILDKYLNAEPVFDGPYSLTVSGLVENGSKQ